MNRFFSILASGLLVATVAFPAQAGQEDLDQQLLNTVKAAGTTDAVNSLLERGANIEAKDFDKETSLVIAVIEGNARLVEILLKARANPNALSEEGTPALGSAAGRKLRKIASLLIKYKAEIDKKDKLGNTPLMIAASFSDPTIVSLLLDNGANINATNQRGATPLIGAIVDRKPEIALLLIERGADHSIGRNPHSQTALECAVVRGYSQVVEKMVVAGADPTVMTKTNESIIVSAVLYQTEMVDTLIAYLDPSVTIVHLLRALKLAERVGQGFQIDDFFEKIKHLFDDIQDPKDLLGEFKKLRPNKPIQDLLESLSIIDHSRLNQTNFQALLQEIRQEVQGMKKRKQKEKLLKSLAKIEAVYAPKEQRQQKTVTRSIKKKAKKPRRKPTQPIVQVRVPQTPQQSPTPTQSSTPLPAQDLRSDTQKLYDAIFEYNLSAVTRMMLDSAFNYDSTFRNADGHTLLMATVKQIQTDKQKGQPSNLKHIFKALLRHGRIRNTIDAADRHGRIIADLITEADNDLIAFIKRYKPTFQARGRQKADLAPPSVASSQPTGSQKPSDQAAQTPDIVNATAPKRSSQARLDTLIKALSQESLNKPKLIALFRAMFAEEKEAQGTTQALLKQTVIDGIKTTLLHYTIQKTSAEDLFSALLRLMGHALNSKDGNGKRPIEIAQGMGKKAYIRIIEAQFPHTVIDPHACIAALAAQLAATSQPESCKDKILRAFQQGNPAQEAHMERLCTDINAINEYCDEEQRTWLMLACRAGDLPSVTQLLTAGAHFDATDRSEKTALAYALENNHEDIANHLCIISALNEFTANKKTSCRGHISSCHHRAPSSQIRKAKNYGKDKPFSIKLKHHGQWRTATQFPEVWKPKDVFGAVVQILSSPTALEKQAKIHYLGQVQRGVIIVCGQHNNVTIEVIISNIASNQPGIHQWRVFTAYPVIEKSKR